MTFRLVFLCVAGLTAAHAAAVEASRIAGDLKDGYQVVIADVNGDGKPDVIAVASGQTDLVWYENPSWTRHVLAPGLHGMINVAAKDIDGDGIPEIAVAYEFATDARKSLGVVAILHHDGDVTKPWKLREIDRLPTSHRLRWARWNGKDILVNAPLTGAADVPPDFRGPAPLVYYRAGLWKREVIGEFNEGVQHGVFCSPHGASDHILTASFSGIDHYEYIAGRWEHRNVNRGDPSPCPKCGSSEVTVGHAGGREFIATIEPWHGNQVAYYVEKAHQWMRSVIDDGLTDGHTLLTVNTGGTNDALIAGYRGAGGGVRLYTWSSTGWNKRVIASGLPASSCAVGKLEGSAGGLDLVCIGGSQINMYRLRDAR